MFHLTTRERNANLNNEIFFLENIKMGDDASDGNRLS